MSKTGKTGGEQDPRIVYQDIIDHPRWKSPTRKPMSMYQRAAQFFRFQPLDGFSDMIAEEERVTDELLELEEYELEKLNRKLNRLSDRIAEGAHPRVTMTVFLPDERKEGGRYVEITDRVKRVDKVEKRIVLMGAEGNGKGNRVIQMEHILTISDDLGEMIDG